MIVMYILIGFAIGVLDVVAVLVIAALIAEGQRR